MTDKILRGRKNKSLLKKKSLNFIAKGLTILYLSSYWSMKKRGLPYRKAFIYQQSSVNNGSKATEYANIPVVDAKERLDSIRVPSVTIKVYSFLGRT